MTWQVSNLELSRTLEGLGCPQGSLWWWVNSSYDGGYEGEGQWYCDNKWTLVDHIPAIYEFTNDSDVDVMEAKIKALKFYSAYTCAELGRMLPVEIELEGNALLLICYKENKEIMCVHYETLQGEVIIHKEDYTEANVRASMLIHLYQHNLIRRERR